MKGWIIQRGQNKILPPLGLKVRAVHTKSRMINVTLFLFYCIVGMNDRAARFPYRWNHSSKSFHQTTRDMFECVKKVMMVVNTYSPDTYTAAGFGRIPVVSHYR